MTEDATFNRRSFLGAAMSLAGASVLPGQARANTKARAKGGPFLWGASTAAYQIEGNCVNADFWVMEHAKPTLFAETSGDACDHYHRYADDFEIAHKLGFNAHRLSIEWSRIEPAPGQFSQAVLDHYERVLESCHAHGLAPFVTYHHFTAPRWFAARGGFETPDSPDIFARFAEKATARLGHLIHTAATFNEPNLLKSVLWGKDINVEYPIARAMTAASAKACGSDRFATFYTGDQDLMQANYIAAHDAAMAAMKSGPGRFPVGVTLVVSEEDGVGPGNKVEDRKRDSYAAWMEVAGRSDFVGVQTYSRNRTGAKGDLGPEAGVELTQMGYEFRPQALEAAIRYAAEQSGVPVIVTENGVATEDDARRIAFIDGAVEGVANCIADGIDVRGYLHWSLLDNFEWISGYRPKFGLVAVDRETFERKPKPSAFHLGQIARSGRL